MWWLYLLISILVIIIGFLVFVLACAMYTIGGFMDAFFGVGKHYNIIKDEDDGNIQEK